MANDLNKHDTELDEAAIVAYNAFRNSPPEMGEPEFNELNDVDKTIWRNVASAVLEWADDY